jgi:hypothetical protein
MDRSEHSMSMFRGRGYSQQGRHGPPCICARITHLPLDAEECYACILNTLRNVPGLDASGSSSGTGAEAQIGGKKFVDQYLMGEMRRE